MVQEITCFLTQSTVRTFNVEILGPRWGFLYGANLVMLVAPKKVRLAASGALFVGPELESKDSKGRSNVWHEALRCLGPPFCRVEWSQNGSTIILFGHQLR